MADQHGLGDGTEVGGGRQVATLIETIGGEARPGTDDPAAGARAAVALTELARLGTALRLSMLRVGIGPPP